MISSAPERSSVEFLAPVRFSELVRAEWFGLRRRPGVLLVSLIWGLQVIVFAYLVLLLIYRTTELSAEEGESFLAALLPPSTDSFIVGSLPLYGGPMMLVIGAIIASGDYRFGTLRTILARYPNRPAFLLARFAGALLVLLAVSVLTLLLSLLCSGVIAGMENRLLDYPDVGSLVVALGAIWLVMSAWGAFGFLLSTVTRNPAGAIISGLVWTLLVENLLFGALASTVPVFEAVRTVLLSPASGSLAHALGAVPADGTSGTPGVVDTVSGPVAVLVLFGYVLVSAAVSVLVFRRRDVP